MLVGIAERANGQTADPRIRTGHHFTLKALRLRPDVRQNERDGEEDAQGRGDKVAVSFDVASPADAFAGSLALIGNAFLSYYYT